MQLDRQKTTHGSDTRGKDYIDKHHEGSYSHAIEYGSNPSKENIGIFVLDIGI